MSANTATPTRVDEATTAATLRELAAALDDYGYGEILGCYLPHKAQAHVWQQSVAKIDGELRQMLELFLLGRSVELDALPERVSSLVPVLEDSGLCRTENGLVWLPNLIILRPLGQWLWCQRPHPNPTMYFGDDSLGLVHRAVTRRGGRALDLCAGPGVQSLTASLRSAHVVGVEINPVAATINRVNIAMNSLEDVMEVRVGDLYGPVAGEVFDDVLSNPPLLPVPEDVQFPFVGDGGRDGFDLVWRIMDGLPEHLSDRGVARVVGTVLSDGYVPVVMPALGAWAAKNDFNVLLTVTGNVAADHDSSWVRSMSLTSASMSGADPTWLQQRYADDYADLGASHVAFYELIVRRGRGTATLADVSPERRTPDQWFI